MSRIGMTVARIRKPADNDAPLRSRHPAAICLFGCLFFGLLLGNEPVGGEEPDGSVSSRRWGDALFQPCQLIIAREPIGLVDERSILDAREVACISASRWQPSIGLRQRAVTIERLHSGRCSKTSQAAKTLACFLELQAAHQQDIGAASALRAYYAKIGVQEQLRLIEEGLEVLGEQAGTQQRLMELGTSAAVDTNALERRRLDLTEKSLEAQAKETQLRSALKSLTGKNYDFTEWIVEPLVIQNTEIECENLVEFAIRERMDLQAWRYLSQRINTETAPMLVSLVGSSIGGYGIPLSNLGGLKRLLTHSSHGDALVENLRCELSVLLQIQEESVRQSVREKCSQLQLAYQVHQIELQRIESWQRRLAQLDRLESLGQPRIEEKLAAEAGWREARAAETIRRTEAKLAEVALSEEVGGLAARCCFGAAWLVTGRE